MFVNLLSSAIDFITQPSIALFARHGGIEKIKALIAKGYNVDETLGDKITALHYAVVRNHREIVEDLLAANANINLRDNEGWTPVHYAVAYRRSDILHLLLQKDEAKQIIAPPATVRAFTPLHLASLYNQDAMIAELIKAGAHLDQQNRLGKTALHCAVEPGHSAAVDKLLKNGADVNRSDDLGQIPLHTAVLAKHKDIIEKLLTAGANISLKNNKGQTALALAELNEATEEKEAIIALLQARQRALNESLSEAIQRDRAVKSSQPSVFIKDLLKQGAKFDANLAGIPRVDRANFNIQEPLKLISLVESTDKGPMPQAVPSVNVQAQQEISQNPSNTSSTQDSSKLDEPIPVVAEQGQDNVSLIEDEIEVEDEVEDAAALLNICAAMIDEIDAILANNFLIKQNNSEQLQPEIVVPPYKVSKTEQSQPEKITQPYKVSKLGVVLASLLGLSAVGVLVISIGALAGWNVMSGLLCFGPWWLAIAATAAAGAVFVGAAVYTAVQLAKYLRQPKIENELPHKPISYQIMRPEPVDTTNLNNSSTKGTSSSLSVSIKTDPLTIPSAGI